MSSGSIVPSGGCTHLATFKASSGLTSLYGRIVKTLLAPCHSKTRSQSAQVLICHQCKKHRSSDPGSRLHICLHCIHFACFPEHWERHQQHERTHVLSVESQYGNIYCSVCGDFIYDPELEYICEQYFNRASHFVGLGTRFNAWKPTSEDIALLRRHRKRKSFSVNATLGLRGLVNLGNTCFMSCIVQSLIHTPLLRDYFLSDRHICLLEEGSEHCIVCEMSRLFQEFYSGAKTPLVPHVLLHMTWTHAHHLAGYEQQDAHEFFIAILNLLHRQLIHRTDFNPSNCSCIVDTIFTGKLQSDVVCQACKNVSTTIDPFWDISLDLPVLPLNQVNPISLHHCLERFTKQEKLGSAAKIFCTTCKSNQESTKQLTMKKLPIVASFHLKRFEHSSKFHKKITTRVAFPEFLDMSPFISHMRNNHNNQGIYESPVRNNMYTLFAVINHIGNIEAGHYTSFIRQHGDKWYRCNDHQIVPTTIQEVLESEGYLLFFHKQKLEYK